MQSVPQQSRMFARQSAVGGIVGNDTPVELDIELTQV